MPTGYCERCGPGLLAEPINASTNLSFLIAAWAAWFLARRANALHAGTWGLIALSVAIGIGSACTTPSRRGGRGCSTSSPSSSFSSGSCGFISAGSWVFGRIRGLVARGLPRGRSHRAAIPRSLERITDLCPSLPGLDRARALPRKGRGRTSLAPSGGRGLFLLARVPLDRHGRLPLLPDRYSLPLAHSERGVGLPVDACLILSRSESSMNASCMSEIFWAGSRQRWR